MEACLVRDVRVPVVEAVSMVPREDSDSGVQDRGRCPEVPRNVPPRIPRSEIKKSIPFLSSGEWGHFIARNV